MTYYGNSTVGRAVCEIGIGYVLGYVTANELPSETSSGGYPYVMFGSGTTPPTANDYTLESPLQKVTYSKGTVVVTETDDKDTYMNCFNITNNNTEAISVSEVGIVVPCPYAGTTSVATKYMLIERTVFDPVTIAPGETATIRYEIVVNW